MNVPPDPMERRDRPDAGIVYVATGSKYIAEALVSARSARAVMPSIPITIFSDSPLESPHDVENVVISDPIFGYGDKVKYLSKTPYDKTLFLDTDTMMVDGVLECFRLLDRFDLLVAHDALRVNIEEPTIDRVFPELNTGVVFFRRTGETLDFLSKWLAAHEHACRDRRCQVADQLTFRRELFDSKLRFYVLPPEYHCMTWEAAYLHDRAKILHGRNDLSLGQIARDVNEIAGPRIFKPGLGCHRVNYKYDIIDWAAKLLRSQVRDCIPPRIRNAFMAQGVGGWPSMRIRPEP
jgi:hypothetical protein